MQKHWLLLGTVILIGVVDVTSSHNVWKLARANSKFAFRLYNKVIDGEDGKNQFFSPFSVSTALAMTSAGARGHTASEMRRVLGFRRLKFNVHRVFHVTLGSLNASHGDYSLAVANALFVDTGLTVRPSFSSLLAKYYSANFKQLDFEGDPNGSAKYINEWVEYKTNGKIKDIVKPKDVKIVVVALANAIYFKGCWKHPFDSADTKVAPFHVLPGEQTSVNMMTQTAWFRYSFNRRLCCQILELPYVGDRLAMYILLPKQQDGLAALENKLTFRRVNSALASLRRRRLSVAIPRFEMTVKKSLPHMLSAMGMKLAFTPDANFRGIALGLYISDVIHKAFIGVDEKGTEAAAATIVLMIRGFPPPPIRRDFVADHPFLFLIRDKKTGSILFMGRLMRPEPE